MLISYNWLQEYFKENLPEPQDLADLLNLKSFEVEGVEKVKNCLGVDYVLDVDILPNRSHDCLSHNGVASEVRAILGLDFEENNILEPQVDFETNFEVKVKHDDCRRYVGCEIQNIKISESPDELKSKMESLGQKSINNLVDITNLIMFEIGQPMHAFDAMKLNDRKIIVRNSEFGEKITTLDKKEVELDDQTLLITDSKKPLAIAGIKGGNNAEVDNDSVNIFLEAANFNPKTVRINTKKVGINTDSSKRFENEISPELASKAMNRAIDLIMQFAATDQTKISNILDHYPRKWRKYNTGISADEASKILGTEITNDEISDVFRKLNFEFELISPREKIKEESLTLLDRPYKYGASVFFDAPNSFDCSSFVSYVYSLVGYTIPRMAVDQFVFAEKISENDLGPGDLIFSNTGITEKKIDFESLEFLKGTKIPSGVDHVGIYLGEGQVIHATAMNDLGVVEENLSQSERFSNIIGYGRIIKDEKRFAVKAPFERLDIKTTPDLAEEIGRIYGYEKIESEDYNLKITNKVFAPKINRHQQLQNLIKNILVHSGFSEIVTYSFVGEGSLEPLKPIASDKAFVRESLLPGMKKALDKNTANAELLGLDYVKTFEIGKVFKKVKNDSPIETELKNKFDWQYNNTTFPESNYRIEEDLILSIGVINKNGASKKQNKIILEETVKILGDKLGLDLKTDFGLKFVDGSEFIEFSLNQVIEKLFESNQLESILGDKYESLPKLGDDIKFKSISVYPFVLRDIAVWIPASIDPSEIIEIVKKYGNDLLVNSVLFDTYEKDDRVSYAHRLVFQSHEKTLTDDEINPIMDKITEEINQKGWEVR